MLISTIALSGCSVTEPRAPTVTLTVSIAPSALSTNDTLVVRRTVRNAGRETVWLDVSSMTPSFSITAANHQRACYLTVATAELRLRAIAPQSSVDEEDRTSLSRLAACPPGTYDVVVTALIYRTQSGPPRPGHLVHSVSQALTVTPP